MIAYYAGIMSLVAALAIVFVFYYVLSNRFPARQAADVVPGIYRIRTVYFYCLIVSIIAASFYAFTHTPYPQLRARGEEPDEYVTVVARKWLWQLYDGAYSENMLFSSETDSIKLPVDKKVEFHVTSADVTHGFGIYDDAGKLISQTQAVPGHIHRLLVKFDSPGIYRVLCMEYCGVGHHVMQTSFQVK